MPSPLLSNRISCHSQYFCLKNPRDEIFVVFINVSDRKNRKQSDIKVKMTQKMPRDSRGIILKCNFHFILSQLKTIWKSLRTIFRLNIHPYLFFTLFIFFILLINKKNPPLFKMEDFTINLKILRCQITLLLLSL